MSKYIAVITRADITRAALVEAGGAVYGAGQGRLRVPVYPQRLVL